MEMSQSTKSKSYTTFDCFEKPWTVSHHDKSGTVTEHSETESKKCLTCVKGEVAYAIKTPARLIKKYLTYLFEHGTHKGLPDKVTWKIFTCRLFQHRKGTWHCYAAGPQESPEPGYFCDHCNDFTE